MEGWMPFLKRLVSKLSGGHGMHALQRLWRMELRKPFDLPTQCSSWFCGMQKSCGLQILKRRNVLTDPTPGHLLKNLPDHDAAPLLFLLP
jgi:hypothetical protein